MNKRISDNHRRKELIQAQVVSGLEFRFTPNPNLTSDVKTTITVYGNETGGSQSIPVTVTYKA